MTHQENTRHVAVARSSQFRRPITSPRQVRVTADRPSGRSALTKITWCHIGAIRTVNKDKIPQAAASICPDQRRFLG
jgi:hypothetical protein